MATVSRPPLPGNELYLAYLRRSLDEAKQADSLTRQLGVIRAWCARAGVDFARVEIVQEPDNTTRDDYAGHREWHARILPRAAAGLFVLVEERSRVGADLDYTIALRDLTVRGAQLVVCASDERPRWTGGMDSIIESFHGAKNKQEVIDTRARTKRGLRDLLERGYWSGLPPYGYRLVADETTRDKRTGKAHVWLRVDETQAPIVLRIHLEYAAGAGYVAIAKRLNAEGVPGPGGRVWQPDRICEILRHPIYRGVVTFGRTLTIRQGGRHVRTDDAPPESVYRATRPELVIIDADLADRVDAAHAGRTATPRPRHVVHPFSGYGRCAKCRGSISTYQNGSGITRYCCDRQRRVGDCDVRVRVETAIVEQQVAAALLADIVSEEMIETIRLEIRGALQAEVTRLRAMQGADVDRLRADQGALHARKQRAVRLATELDGDQDVLAELRRVKQQMASLEAQIATIERTAGLDDISLRRIEADAVGRLEGIRAAISDRSRMREALMDLFPAGLVFHPDGESGWIITGDTDPLPCTSTGGTLLPPVNVHVIPFRVRVA
jgi:site-specific DNA recombinase